MNHYCPLWWTAQYDETCDQRSLIFKKIRLSSNHYRTDAVLRTMYEITNTIRKIQFSFLWEYCEAHYLELRSGDASFGRLGNECKTVDHAAEFL